jgi:hypothetical protein
MATADVAVRVTDPPARSPEASTAALKKIGVKDLR